MERAYLIGLDIAKNVFQVFIADKTGRQISNKKLKRSQVKEYFTILSPSKIGIEACGTSHYWARELQKLGHEVCLIQPIRVKAFLGNRNKTDAADARAICEALMHPGTRFVSIKTEAQQDMDHILSMRERLISNRTQLINQLRSFLAERGIVAPKGRSKFDKHISEIMAEWWDSFDVNFQIVLEESIRELEILNERIGKLDELISNRVKENEACQNLMSVPGIGAITASALAAHIGDIHQFKNGRQLSAYLGITPREHSSGGKQKLLSITKHGSKRIRTLLIIAARAVMTGLARRKKRDDGSPVIKSDFEKWILALQSRIGTFKCAVALANKMARIIWVILIKREVFNPSKACGVAVI